VYKRYRKMVLPVSEIPMKDFKTMIVLLYGNDKRSFLAVTFVVSTTFFFFVKSHLIVPQLLFSSLALV
jgi:hypothetical protein